MFAKLTSIKLTSDRMSGQACLALRPTPVLPAAPVHANDNRAPRHRRDSARPVLTCRWIPAAAGGLECRWSLADGEAARPDGPRGARGAQRPIAAGGRPLALVAGRAHRAP